MKASGQEISRDEEMQLEYLRVATFENWPNDIKVNILKIAKAGFYYIGGGTSDKVQCFSCHGKLSNWDGRGDPLDEHRQVSPGCEFLKQRQGENIPPVATDRDNHIGPANSTPNGENMDKDREYWRNVIPVHSDMVDENMRLASFDRWPKHVRQFPHELAEAGFYYSGIKLCYK